MTDGKKAFTLIFAAVCVYWMAVSGGFERAAEAAAERVEAVRMDSVVISDSEETTPPVTKICFVIEHSKQLEDVLRLPAARPLWKCPQATSGQSPELVWRLERGRITVTLGSFELHSCPANVISF